MTYPLATIAVSAGETIPSDIPTVTGTVTSFSVTPALPAGLSLDAATGTISGTPTTPVSQASYTIAAFNSAGSTTSIVTITILPAKNILLELGHAGNIETLRFAGGHVLSAEGSAHWVLWDYSSGSLLASGDGITPFKNCDWKKGWCPNTPLPPRYGSLVDMAGAYFVVTVSNGLEIHAQSDGHLVSLIVFPGLNLFGPDPYALWQFNKYVNWWQLAIDGSYVSIGSKSGLYV